MSTGLMLLVFVGGFTSGYFTCYALTLLDMAISERKRFKLAKRVNESDERTDDIVNTIKNLQQKTDETFDKYKTLGSRIHEFDERITNLSSEVHQLQKDTNMLDDRIRKNHKVIADLQDELMEDSEESEYTTMSIEIGLPEDEIVAEETFKREILKLVEKHRKICLDITDDRIDGEDCNISLGIILQYLQELGIQFSEEEKELFL